MKFSLNGKKVTYTGNPDTKLLDYLRLEAGIYSPKRGCDYEGACGCCTVQQNDKAILSCITKMKNVEGTDIITIEGMDLGWQEVFASSFVEKGGIQCGFCTPGIVMQAKVLLEKNPDPSRAEVYKAIKRNLCRCTGYHKVVDSIMCAAKALNNDEEVEIQDESGRVGTRYGKYQSHLATLGALPFVDDMVAEDMRFGALKFSDHPRAKILSIDTSKAEKLEGVSRVFTSKDIPGNPIVGIIIPDWPVMRSIGEETRYLGDVLAGVVASTNEIARKAVELIQVEYDVLDPVTDIFEALKDDAPQVHKGGNVLSRSQINRGDADKALKASAFISKGKYITQRIEHAFLEPESCLVVPWKHDGNDGITVFSQGQGAYEDRKQIASLLKLPENLVNVIQVQTGGGFGGKEDLTVQGHAALFAHLLKTPVKITLNRTESILMHPKRHPFVMDYAVGCDKQGKLTAIKAELYCDTGAYASVGMKVLERAVGHSTGAYSVPNADVKGAALYTNNIPCGAMRGFGVNQANFAMESCIEDLCEQGGFDRWKFRYDNAIRDGEQLATGQIIKGGAGVRATLMAVKDEFYKAKYAGIACGIKNTGIGNGMADIGRCKIEIIADDMVMIHHGWTEMGQGVHTIALQTLVEETGIDPDIIEVVVDTRAEAVTGMTTASRATSLLGNSVIAAAKKLKEDLKTKSLEDLVGNIYYGEWICDWTTEIGTAKTPEEEVTHYSYGYATQVVSLNDDGKINTIYAAHDAGKIMNPTLFEGQIEGAIHMGLGYALTEELPMEKGRPLSTKFSKCGIIRAPQVPNIVVKGIEVADPFGPYGAKGVGEIGLVPTAPAVANALFQFDKRKRYELPLKEKSLLP